MQITCFSAKSYEQEALLNANAHQHQWQFVNEALNQKTVKLAEGSSAICCFVTDPVSATVMNELAQMKIQLIALRTAGFDHVDLVAAAKHQITVVRVPNYSPQAIAEFAVALILTLNRKLITTYQQGQRHNFTLTHLLGFNLYQKTVGIIGTGHIGTAFSKIMQGFGCEVIAYDPVKNKECEALSIRYVALNELLKHSDIVSLHCPLNTETQYIMNHDTLNLMKPGAMLINTGRGGLVDTDALLASLNKGHLGYAGLDVYEHEQGVFFNNLSQQKLTDQKLLALLALPNVLISPHQAFFTREAIEGIANTTIENINAFVGGKVVNEVRG